MLPRESSDALNDFLINTAKPMKRLGLAGIANFLAAFQPDELSSVLLSTS